MHFHAIDLNLNYFSNKKMEFLHNFLYLEVHEYIFDNHAKISFMNTRNIVTACIIYTVCTVFIQGNSYFCDFQCGSQHTACYREPCGSQRNCGKQFLMAQMKNEDRDYILTLHNNYRSFKAGHTAGRRKAKNMQVLSYNLELEFVAQCWANTCHYTHDLCRNTSKFFRVGQNIFVADYLPDNYTDLNMLDMAFAAWQREVLPTRVVPAYRTNPNYENAAQLVWGETTAVGCGRARFGRGSAKKYIVICNYGPACCKEYEAVYQEGRSCLECDCLSEYRFLCGSIVDYRNDDWEAPFILRANLQYVNFKLMFYLLILVSLCIR